MDKFIVLDTELEKINNHLRFVVKRLIKDGMEDEVEYMLNKMVRCLKEEYGRPDGCVHVTYVGLDKLVSRLIGGD